MEPPISQPEFSVCPHCGAFIGKGKIGYCPSCGAVLRSASKSILALPVVGVGACFLLFSGALDGKPDWQMVGITLGCFLVALLCL